MEKLVEIDKTKLIIRKGNRNDIDAITKFNIYGSEETTNQSPPVDDIKVGVSFVLRGHQDFYLVAKYENEYVGQCKVHHHWYDWYDASFWWVEHLYVAKKYRKQGIASMILDEVSKLAKENGYVKKILLHVHQDNHLAIKAYEKWGFDIHDNKLMYWSITNGLS
ncbi:GNAT family N-acetyltransferase [Pseudanabaena sp. PCC 6802]|uniref:GNAT family N-acetyltransferase n=1 Tax=Pseudanabaena sp. PCC 6802 TaxID=118173 RepID=UPI0003792032|nr:GNAT family N-acetyltransferase [Pseudanabaena sp. PCC 6802]